MITLVQHRASTHMGRIDYLTLTYSGNRLSTVKDTGSAAYGNDFRYSNTTTTTTDYTGTLVLEDGTRSRMLFDGGYLR